MIYSSYLPANNTSYSINQRGLYVAFCLEIDSPKKPKTRSVNADAVVGDRRFELLTSTM
jgi:hypothetical protein